MATLTASAAAANGPPARKVHAGIQHAYGNYTGSTAISPSATVVLMCKVPNGARILDVAGLVSSGADTCPFTLGIHTHGGTSADASAFATGGTKAVLLRATKGLPYDISMSDDAQPQYTYITATVVPGTVTTEVEIKTIVTYTMDKL